MERNKVYDRFLKATAIIVVEKQHIRPSMIQLKFMIGYNRAGRIIDQLEELGIIGLSKGAKERNVLIKDMTSLDKHLESIGIDLGEQTLQPPYWQ